MLQSNVDISYPVFLL